MSTPRVALELPDSAEQCARLVEPDDPRLHVERVQHPSVASCSMQNLGSEQRIAATVGSGAAHLAETIAIKLSRSELATTSRDPWCSPSVRYAAQDVYPAWHAVMLAGEMHMTVSFMLS